MNTIEHRNSKRIHFDCHVDVAFKDQNFEAETDNISLNGMLIKTDRYVPVEKVGEICLKYEKSVFVCANFVVVRKGHNGLGVQFKSLNFNSFTHIKALVDWHTSLSM